MRLSHLVSEHCELSDEDYDWLSSLVREWQLLADTSFSDLVLWLPDRDDQEIFWAVDQIRPVTGPTALAEDVVGETIEYEADSQVASAFISGEIIRDSENNIAAGIPVENWAIPIVRHGQVIAVVEVHSNRMGLRAPGALEDAYVQVAAALTEQLQHGEFPIEPPSDPSMSPKVVDGMLLIAYGGIVRYASPNSVSCMRRLGVRGDLIGEDIRDLVPRVVDKYDQHVLPTKTMEFCVEFTKLAFRVRIIPLQLADGEPGVMVLCRDVTLLMERERELVNKDATIREIHHRVKNNLQTVAALLRLQSRRMHSEEAKDALRDAQRRVQSIAAVHEILSQGFGDDVNFDAIADQILRMVADVAVTQGQVRVVRDGSLGQIPGDVATSLSLVLAELCQNAIEHGLSSSSGQVKVHLARDESDHCAIEVVDDGVGLPADFDLAEAHSLGLSIVTTLVQDLNGSFELTNNDGCGATASVKVSWQSWNLKSSLNQ